MAQQKQGEAAQREAGYKENGGVPLNVPLEDGQRRGVDEDGNIVQGTHGGPDEPKQKGRNA
jgi:hypothetical protein